jgi:TFIIF-interacting CTD phosphatase-like protein
LGFSLARTVIVDDDARTWTHNYGNAVAVKPWTGDPADTELGCVLEVLRRLDGVPDVRRVNKSGSGIR